MRKLKTKLISLGGLIHDIGKMLERGRTKLRIPRDEFEWLTGEACKEAQGHATHLHAAFTLWFCQFLEDRFLCLRNLDETLKNWKYWCACHHRNEPGLEFRIIKQADRLSSSEREQGDFYIPNVNRKTLLEPVIERVFLWNNERVSTMHRYPLKPLSSDQESCFPLGPAQLGLETMAEPDRCTDKNQWRHLLSKDSLEDQYEDLCQGFLDEITTLSETSPVISLDNLYVTLMRLIEKYTANIPSATNLRHPDISLYDHLRTTAAISECMYLHTQENGAGIDDKSQWTLACGDFSGIQKFIYNLTNKGAAKGLKGRSFYVQFFCRLCSDHILRELGLSKACCLYNSGGKFYLMIPEHFKDRLLELRSKINEQLLEEFSGDVFLGLGLCDITQDMFAQGGMHEAWKKTAVNLARDRQHKFKSLINHDFFSPDFEADPSKSCNVCGSRKNVGTSDTCRTCRQLQTIGSHLGDTTAIFCNWDTTETSQIRNTLGLREDRVIRFRLAKDKTPDVLFITNDQLTQLKNIGSIDGECIFLNELADQPLADIHLPKCAVSSLYLAKWQKTENDWDFETFADKAEGVKRLGILRMDVDNLGLVFIRGLNFLKHQNGWGAVEKTPKGELLRVPMASISRMATLSRQLNHFFSSWFPRMMRESKFDRSQIIYAGGDDLFVIGSWDELPALAKTVRDEFMTFCCGNADLGISGGISLQKGKYPIYKGAQLAGDAEEKAKNLMKEWAGIKTKKDSLTFLGVSIPWSRFDEAYEIKQELIQDCNRENNKGLLSYLMKMVVSYIVEVDKRAKRQGLNKAWDAVAYFPWRWRLHYFLKRRYVKKEGEMKKWLELILGDHSSHANQPIINIPAFVWLGLPVKWANYKLREGKNNG